MIGSLRGTVLERIPPSVLLVEVAGVGYLCNVAPSTFAELEPTVEVFLHVHHHIREDAQTLYGFRTRAERDAFDMLIDTHGVGPAMAMSILSVFTPQALATVIASGDTAALTSVPGVGRKTAERLMVELKSRLSGGLADVSAAVAGIHSVTADVREALAALGYSAEEIREAMRQVANVENSETMLRDALALLGARRAG
ncbi:MAG: Holliday junction branch migration protein RuvA [Acidimicrobiales bacterium]